MIAMVVLPIVWFQSSHSLGEIQTLNVMYECVCTYRYYFRIPLKRENKRHCYIWAIKLNTACRSMSTYTFQRLGFQSLTTMESPSLYF